MDLKDEFIILKKNEDIEISTLRFYAIAFSYKHILCPKDASLQLSIMDL